MILPSFYYRISNRNQNKKNRRNQERRPRRQRRGRGGGNTSPTKKQGIGASIGSWLGNAAEKGLKTLFGAGEYTEAIQSELPEEERVEPSGTPHTNSLISPGNSNSIPAMHNDSEGNVRITRREYIGDLDAPGVNVPAEQYRFAITPGDTDGGNSLMAPWLNGIAKHWQKYAFMGAVFEYIPTSSILATADSPALGSISMGVQYDPLGASGSYSKLDVLNLDNGVSGSPAASSLISVECAPDQTFVPIKFIREQGWTPSEGIRFTDLGLLIIHLEGFNLNAAAFTVGELWVTYDVVLMGTKLPLTIASLPPSSYLPAELLAAYKVVFKNERAFRPVGMTPQEHLALDCAVEEAKAVLAAPKAKVAWVKAEYKARAIAEGFFLPKKISYTPPPPLACPPGTTEGVFV